MQSPYWEMIAPKQAMEAVEKGWATALAAMLQPTIVPNRSRGVR